MQILKLLQQDIRYVMMYKDLDATATFVMVFMLLNQECQFL